MLGSAARRSLTAAAAEHMNLRVLADGMEDSQKIAEKMLEAAIAAAMISWR